MLSMPLIVPPVKEVIEVPSKTTLRASLPAVPVMLSESAPVPPLKESTPSPKA